MDGMYIKIKIKSEYTSYKWSKVKGENKIHLKNIISNFYFIMSFCLTVLYIGVC